MEKGLISVDRWDEQSQAYFLTHLHADHTQGLSRRWKRGPLFCSPTTARLFPAKFPGFDSSLIRALEIGSTHLISLVSPSSGSEIVVRVTAIDALHCPGSVMYLFRGEFGSMLYTGDFRWETNSDKTQSGKNQILSILEGDKLDIVYLDNTYCNPLFSFPPRDVVAQQLDRHLKELYLPRRHKETDDNQETYVEKTIFLSNSWYAVAYLLEMQLCIVTCFSSAQENEVLRLGIAAKSRVPKMKITFSEVVDIITSHPDYDVIIGLNTLGKEDLLLHISRALKTKIWVWPERLQIMHLLGFGDVFTTSTALTRVRAVPRYSLTIKNLEGLNTVHPTIGILPSGLPWVRPVEGKDSSVGSDLCIRHKSRSRNSRAVDVNQVVASRSPKLLHQHLYSVPYSDHSCFSEILEFVKFIKPSNMKGIVSSSVCYVNPSHYFRDLCEDIQDHQQADRSSESVEIIQSKSVSGHDKSSVATVRKRTDKDSYLRKRTDKDSYLGACKRRVSISRRERIGARIAETENTS